MTEGRPRRLPLPEPVRQTIDDLARYLALDLRLVECLADGSRRPLHPEDPHAPPRGPASRRALTLDDDWRLEIEVRTLDGSQPGPAGELAAATVERMLTFTREIRFFTSELSDRYEEINLLYTISEILGQVITLEDAAYKILHEVCEVMHARRGSLWVHDPARSTLRLVASVGDDGLRGPVSIDDTRSLTARVFRDGAAVITGVQDLKVGVSAPSEGGKDTVLSVPIRYTPPEGDARTVGVINLIGRMDDERFSTSDQRLLAAIASQVGAALENNRLVQKSLEQERLAREMELAHNLQLKLLPQVDRLKDAEVAARVEAAEMVGGDFYQVFSLSGRRVGVMIGDVSGHGFPAALIMALSISAATIYASESDTPARVLRHIDDALRDELETTEMYLSLVYAVLDADAGTLVYSNAGHPHAFVITGAGEARRLDATDPPVGIAGPDAYGQVEHAWNAAEDVLLLFTDGLSDTLASNVSSGETLVVETAVANRTRAPAEVVEALFALDGARQPAAPSDDRSALVLRGAPRR